MVQASWGGPWEVARCVVVSPLFVLPLFIKSVSAVGYGATTFPGLTEALVYDKNATLAQEEAKRLQKLVDALVKELKP